MDFPATPRDENDLLKLHLAEYDALTTRCTNYITLHVGIWGVAVVLLAAVADQWSKNREALTIWIGMAAVQGLLQIWVTLIEDQYLTVWYIERDLRFWISTSLPGVHRNAFWRYEQFIGRNRRTESWWGEWIAPMLVAVLLVLLGWWRWPSSPSSQSSRSS